MTSLGINVIYFVLLDRLMMADVQRRSGPQNVGFFGSLQPMDDGLKLIKKELIIPIKSNGNVFLLVPILFFDFSLILFSILPLEDFGVNLDFSFTILFQLFLSNFNLQSNITAGFTSNSKYSLYGSLRIGAQILSQEIIIGSSSLIILLAANTLTQSELIEYQFDLNYSQ